MLLHSGGIFLCGFDADSVGGLWPGLRRLCGSVSLVVHELCGAAEAAHGAEKLRLLPGSGLVLADAEAAVGLHAGSVPGHEAAAQGCAGHRRDFAGGVFLDLHLRGQRRPDLRLVRGAAGAGGVDGVCAAVHEAADKKEAEKDNISIKDNGGYISLAERQCVNARVQGGAATMSKKAMMAVYRDKQMNDMDFKILIAVHDELIGECPEIYKDAVADRLCEIMKHAADDVANVPFKCDPTIESVWYESDYASVLCKEYKDLQKDHPDEEALQILTQQHCECLPAQIKKFLEIS